ncbi:MAG: 3'-5' exonuclease [Bryobacteraceae bacterium]
MLVGSKSFHRREEVGTIRAGLRAIEWPDDELSVFAVLHGSLFAIPDNALLKYKDQFKSFHPFRTLPDDLDQEFWPIREALQLLAGLHRQRNAAPVADTINRLLEGARAHAGFAFRKGGERVVANVYRLCDLAREFDRSVSTSFRSFIEYLEEEQDSGEMAEAPVLEQQADGVKLMTVHKAKGLEFPVVILADLTAKLTGKEGGDRYVDEAKALWQCLIPGCTPWEMLEHAAEEEAADRAEAHRLAYVAATRARDLLVVSSR